LYGTDQRLTEYSRAVLAKAKEYFVGHTGEGIGGKHRENQAKYPATTSTQELAAPGGRS
jgi:hypothetical protein